MTRDELTDELLDTIEAAKGLHERTIYQGASQPLVRYRDELVAWKERTLQLVRRELGRDAARDFAAVADPGVLGPTVPLLDDVVAKYATYIQTLVDRLRTDRAGTAGKSTPIPAFCSYSSKDDAYRERFQVALAVLEREELLTMWEFRSLEAGTEWDAEIRKHLHAAKLIFLLLSPDFFASRYSVEEELATALKRHTAGTARIVPIIVRPCDWLHTDLRKLQALPKDGKAITEWANTDAAWQDVTNGIRRVVQSLNTAGEASQPEMTRRQRDVLRVFAKRGRRPGEGLPVNVFVGDRDAMEAIEELVGAGALAHGKNHYVLLTDQGYEVARELAEN
jgi:hypothetical protein